MKGRGRFRGSERTREQFRRPHRRIRFPRERGGANPFLVVLSLMGVFFLLLLLAGALEYAADAGEEVEQIALVADAGTPSAQQLADARLAARDHELQTAANSILLALDTEESNVTATAEKGVVYLQGAVASVDEALRLEHAVRLRSEAADVQNNITVKTIEHPPEPDREASAEKLEQIEPPEPPQAEALFP